MHPGLVFDEGPKLSERPFSELIPLARSNRCPVTDARKILEGHSLSGAFGLQNQFPGNDMVRIVFESMFPSGNFFETTLCALCSFLLKPLFVGGSFLSYFLDGFSGKRFSIGIGRKIFDAKVYAKKFLGIPDGFFRNLDRLKKIEFPLVRDQIGFALDVGKPIRAMADEGNGLSPFDCPQRNRIFFEGENPGIVSQSSPWKKCSLDFFPGLVGIRHLGDAPDDHLSGQRRRILQVVIDKFVNPELIERLFFPRRFGNPVAGGVRFPERLQKYRRLLFGRKKFDLQGQLHGKSLFQIFESVNRKESVFLPAVNGEGSNARKRMKPVSVLLIGLGRVGSRFYEKFRQMGEGRVRILGVCEIDPSHPVSRQARLDGIPVFEDYHRALRPGNPPVDIILDTTNIPEVKNDLRRLLEESGNHHTVLLPLVASYLLWHMAAPGEELVQDHVDPGY